MSIRSTFVTPLQEATLLEDVAVQFSNTYDFVSNNTPASKMFSELFDALVRRRDHADRMPPHHSVRFPLSSQPHGLQHRPQL